MRVRVIDAVSRRRPLCGPRRRRMEKVWDSQPTVVTVRDFRHNETSLLQ